MEDTPDVGPSTAAEPAYSVEPAEDLGRHKLSCDGCRLRKVGCDRRSPCSRCHRLGVLCTYDLGYKARPKRDRRPAMLGSLECKIDDISEKLEKLCFMIEDANSGLIEPKRPPDVATPNDDAGAAATRTPRVSGHVGEGLTGNQNIEHEGETSLAAHANFTTQILENAVITDASMSRQGEMTLMIRDIRHAINPTSDPGFDATDSHNATPTSINQPLQPVLPPIQLTLNCLRMLKENPVMRYFWAMEFESIGQVTEQLLSAYATDRQSSTAEWIITYIGLHYLFTQGSQFAADSVTQERYAAQIVECRKSADAVLARLPLHIPSTMDYVLALTLATQYCMGQCKATMAWTYISTASRMSQAMGLQQIACRQGHDFDADARQKTKLFFAMMILEKNLSLQLGRSSTLRDHDLGVPLKDIRMGHQVGGSLGIMSPKWLQISQIEGRVYEEIYSPAALQQPPSQRNARANLLASGLKTIIQESRPFESEFLRERRRAVGEKLDDLLTQCDKVSNLSLMCLIYRGVSVDNAPFCDECIDTARQALAEHAKSMSLIESHEIHLFDMCINWALLSSSFVPFFVILCNAVWTLNLAELELLGSLVNSLEAGQNQDTFSASRLLRTIKPLYTAALKYIELKSQAAPTATNISFETIYQETASTTAPGPWPGISTLTPLEHFVAEPDSMSVSTAGISDCFATSNSNATFHAQPGLELESGGFEHLYSDHSTVTTRSQGSQLGEWFMQSRYMMDLLEEQQDG